MNRRRRPLTFPGGRRRPLSTWRNVYALSSLAEALLLPGLMASGVLLTHAIATARSGPITQDGVVMRFRLWLITRELRGLRPEPRRLAARH